MWSLETIKKMNSIQEAKTRPIIPNDVFVFLAEEAHVMKESHKYKLLPYPITINEKTYNYILPRTPESLSHAKELSETNEPLEVNTLDIYVI